MRDIWVITKETPRGRLDEAMSASAYTDRIVCMGPEENLEPLLNRHPDHMVLTVGFQGEWWEWPEIRDILFTLSSWETPVDQLPGHILKWLPDNWFMPKSWVPLTADPEEIYAWMETQL